MRLRLPGILPERGRVEGDEPAEPEPRRVAEIAGQDVPGGADGVLVRWSKGDPHRVSDLAERTTVWVEDAPDALDAMVAGASRLVIPVDDLPGALQRMEESALAVRAMAEQTAPGDVVWLVPEGCEGCFRRRVRDGVTWWERDG